MYGWLWRHTPGPTWLKATIFVVVAAAIVVALFGWGFQAVSPYLPFNENTVGE